MPEITTLGGPIKTAYEGEPNTNAFTDTEKNKLAGIEAGAEVNTVNTVAGKQGDVVLNKSDVGLANVDNTADLSKPISTATQTALNLKVASDVTGIAGATVITNTVALTQAQFNAIPTPSDTTFYVIKDA